MIGRQTSSPISMSSPTSTPVYHYDTELDATKQVQADIDMQWM